MKKRSIFQTIQFPYYKNISAKMNFLLLLLVLFVSYISVWALRESPFTASVCIAVTGITFLCYTRSWKLTLIYGISATVGTLQELFFISKGLWIYHIESSSSIPFYLPFVWGNIGIIVVSAFKGMRILDRKKRLFHNPPRFIPIITLLILFISTTFFSLNTLYRTPEILIAVFFLLDVAYILLMRSAPLALVGFFSFVGGAIGDLISVSLGIWSYPEGISFFHVPLYVFIGWDIIGLFIAGLYVALDARDTFFLPKNSVHM